MPHRETILIIGSSGFLGSHLAEAGAKAGLSMIGVDMHPPRRPELWQRFAEGQAASVDYHTLLEGTRISSCFFLAGSASVAQSLTHPYADFSALVPAVAYLLDYLRAHQPDAHLVYFSSAAVYGQPQQLPVRESDAAAPITPYGAHKHLVEAMLGHYARVYGVSSTALRIFSAYGPLNRRMLFWDLLQKWQTAHREGRDTINAFGTGSETRDFIHARDVAAAALAASRHPRHGTAQVVNVAAGREVSIREAADLLLAGLPGRIRVDFSGEVRAGDPRNWVADVTRLREMGCKPSVDLDAGLREYGAWFLDRPEAAH